MMVTWRCIDVRCSENVTENQMIFLRYCLLFLGSNFCFLSSRFCSFVIRFVFCVLNCFYQLNVLKLHFLFKTSVYIFIYHCIAAGFCFCLCSLSCFVSIWTQNFSQQAVAFILPPHFFAVDISPEFVLVASQSIRLQSLNFCLFCLFWHLSCSL